MSEYGRGNTPLLNGRVFPIALTSAEDAPLTVLSANMSSDRGLSYAEKDFILEFRLTDFLAIRHFEGGILNSKNLTSL